MTDIALGMAADQIEEIAKRRARSRHEIAEPGVPRADKPPNDSHDDDPADDIAGPFMQFTRFALFFARDIGNGESGDERPMPEAYQGIPHSDARGFSSIPGPLGSGGKPRMIER